jgi:hypothetical protein
MGRVEKFKEIRLLRRKYIFSFLLIVVVFVAGICFTDYSINSLMKNENRLSIVTYSLKNNSNIEISILNNKFYFDISYLKRDLGKLKTLVGY